MFKKLDQKEIEELKKLLKLFPKTVKVNISLCEEGGFCAKVLEPKSLTGVITEGETLPELVEMINDGIFTALDIPQKYYSFLPPYQAPVSLYKHFGLYPSIKTEDILDFSITSRTSTCK